MKTLTSSEYNSITDLEDRFFKSTKANYCPFPGTDGIQRTYDIAVAHGWRERFPGDCQHCILSLFKFVGELFFNTKDAPKEEEYVKPTMNTKKSSKKK